MEKQWAEDEKLEEILERRRAEGVFFCRQKYCKKFLKW